ncbi:epimerase family protein SDR39U1-like isoform X2 [Daktulosphaira vitifoliae]|uniref:epimerase family protein SDR39U1-like isoform X2 n=1 Tax=Daktulosphaira vitifoliae TaxID=58002 RepID=UPI0021AACB80|nr:epimerase family protein SDR39U1-like isoform X2 [Daktulosphaira vitifoliae]
MINESLCGGTGFTGQRLKTFLIENNYDVIILSRNKKNSDKTLSWDDLIEKGLPSGTIAVINTAGEPIMNPFKMWNENFKKELWNSRINTNKFIVNAIQQTVEKPKAFIVFSGVGIYPPSSTSVYDENYHPIKEFDYFSKLVIGIEKSAKVNLDSVRSIAIRSGVILGKSGGLVKQLYPSFLFGLGSEIGSGKQYLPWIHINDICRLVIFSIENNTINGVLNGVAPQTITNSEFTQSFAKALNRPAFFKLPGILFNLAYGPERATMVLDGQNVKPKKSLEMGFKFDYDTIDKAMKQIVNE